MSDTRAGDTIKTDVVIVGGGLAGLTTAIGLRQSGLRTLVIESDEILGGRARSWIDKQTGDPVHVGPHIFLSEYPNMIKLLEMLGTQDRIVWLKDRFILRVEGQVETEMKMAKLPAPFHFLPSLLRDKTIGPADIISNVPMARFVAALDEEDILKLDNVNASAFLRSMGITEHFLRQFWSFTSMAIMNVPLELCSAGALLRFFRRLIGHKEYYVGLPDRGLGDLFAPQAKELIESSGGTIWLNTTVKEFTGGPEGATGVRLTDGRVVQARFCVAALPPQALRALAPRQWVAQHRELRELAHFHPSPYISTYLWFDRKLTDQHFWARAYDPDDLNCDFYDLSNSYSGYEGRNSLICSNIIFCERANHLSDEEVVQQTVRELAEYLPQAADAVVEHSVVNRIPMAIHCPFPGTEQRRLPVRSPVANLFLAGDWIRTRLPSSMESACMAGWLAAEEILEQVGRHQSLAIEQKEVEGFVKLWHQTARFLPMPKLPRWVRNGRLPL